MRVLGESSLSGGEEEHEGHDWVISSGSKKITIEMPTDSVPDEITEEPAKRSTSLDFSCDLSIPLIPVPLPVTV